MVKLAHIINPVQVRETSDLFFAQPITFKTMKVAQKLAKQSGIEVQLFSAQYVEDKSIVPKEFIKTPDLDQSVLSFGDFIKPRKLPLIQDILNRLYDNTNADYLIYTNVDIAVMPNFYITVNYFIEQGYDAFVINRRTISKKYTKLEDVPLMYSEIGKKHPGYDCFIFPSSVYSKYNFEKVCIGASGLGKAFVINQVCNSKKFSEFRDFHLTFHVGDDKIWKNQEYNDYQIHNVKQVRALLENYKPIKPTTKEILTKLRKENENDLNCMSEINNKPKININQIYKKYKNYKNKIKKYFKDKT